MGNSVGQDLIRSNYFGVIDKIVIPLHGDGNVGSSLSRMYSTVLQRRQVANEIGNDMPGNQACVRSIVASPIRGGEGSIGRDETCDCGSVVED